LFVVHADIRSQTGMAVSLWKRFIVLWINKTKNNACSSTEAELIDINDAMMLVIWTWNLLMAQWHTVNDNIIFQGNQSVIFLKYNVVINIVPLCHE